METQKNEAVNLNVNEVNFHSILKDVENMFWFFLLSIRTLSDEEIQNLLKIKNTNQEGYASFNEMLRKFNDTTNLKIEKKGNITTSTMNVLKEMIFMGKAMTIFTYELLSASDYSENIKNDEEFKFLRHVRNGAAHNNKFDLKYRFGKKAGEWGIKENEFIKWNGFKIDRKLQGTAVFNDFISIFNIFLLANHFSEKLKAIDSV